MNFLGIDLHSNRFTVAQMTKTVGKTCVKTVTYDLQGASFHRFLDSSHPEDYVLIENSTNAFWFHDQILDRVSECYVLNTAKLTRSGNKTDKLDAKKLVTKLAYFTICDGTEDDMPTVYVPDPKVRELRSLFTTYGMYKRIQTQLKNRIHSLVKQNGICLDKGTLKRVDPAPVLDQLSLPELCRLQIDKLFNSIQQISGSATAVEEQIILLGSELFKDEVELLIGIAGVSAFIATSIMSEVADITRFSSAKKFCSYLRTAPKVEESNNTRHMKAVNKASRATSCTLLTQTVQHLATAGDHLAAFYKRVQVGKSKGTARIALIRKVMVCMFYMLKRHEAFNWINRDLYGRKLKEYRRRLAKLRERKKF